MAPSISDAVASTLIAKHTMLPKGIHVVLDYSEDVFRLGYGVSDAVRMLTDAGIQVGQQPGLRISCLIIDHKGWIFTLPPGSVEPPDSTNFINAIEINPENIESILASVGSPYAPEGPVDSDVESSQIGTRLIDDTDQQSVEENLKTNPPQPFDLQRKVWVYQALIQFVEVELEGGRIQQRTIPIPHHLNQHLLKTEKDLSDRFKAKYKLVDEKALEGLAKIRKDVENVRDTYAPSLGKRWGRVILKEKKQDFLNEMKLLEDQLTYFCQNELHRLQTQIEASLNDLAAELAPSLKRNPPKELSVRSTKVTEQSCKEYILDSLFKSTPSAKSILENTKLHTTFKDVTIETLKDTDFQNSVKDKFPAIQWEKPFNDYHAAPASDSQLDFMGRKGK